MNEFIEKLIGRLSDMFAESEDCVHKMCESKTDEECRMVTCEQCYVAEMKKIINELAEEYNGGWIMGRVPTEEECGLFKKAWFLVTIPQIDGNATTVMQYEYTTVRGKCVSRWLWYGRIASVEPIAWQPLPAPYNPKGE